MLTDAAPPSEFRVGEALPPAATPLLRDLGLLPRFLAAKHLPSYGNASAWGSDELGFNDFIFDPAGHGHHLDRARFDAMVHDAAAEAGAQVIPGARVVSGTAGEVRLWRSGRQEEVACRWVVDATGRSGAIARARGATRLTADRLLAFWARFGSPRAENDDEDTRTLVESCPEGWWYTALVPSRERVIAFLTDEDLADRGALLSPDGFSAQLSRTAHVQAIVDVHGYRILGRPRGADASSTRLDMFAGPGWVAAGDAALAFDPLSSQGILNALYSGMKAGEALDEALTGDADALDRYAAHLEEIAAAYAANWAAFYAHEDRWPDRPFWRRRAGRDPAGRGSA
jgi:flavin-dependent dehydrogenase